MYSTFFDLVKREGQAHYLDEAALAGTNGDVLDVVA